MPDLSLGSDPWGQVSERLEFDGDDVRVVWNGDNSAFDEARKQMRATGENGWNTSRELRRIIELAPSEIMLISGMYGVKPLSKAFDEVVLRLANDPDWKNLKVTDGAVRSKARAPAWL